MLRFAPLYEQDKYPYKLLALDWLSLDLFEPSYSTQTNAETKIPVFRKVSQIIMTGLLWGHSPSISI